jgi:HK97 gp10 family phage protein
MGITVKVEGINEMVAKLNALGANNARMANAILNAGADNIVLEAKQSAPADLGKIRQGIGKEQEGNTIKIFCNAPEAIYQEFGTGPMVDVPERFSDVAQAGKDSGSGTWADFILALTGWISRHGLLNTYSVKSHRVSFKATKDQNEQLAYVIARKILREGLKPQPFLYPALINNEKKILDSLNVAFRQFMRSPQSYF